MDNKMAEQAIRKLLRALWKATKKRPSVGDVSAMIDLAYIVKKSLSAPSVPDDLGACPGPGKCNDQGCPAHYAEVEALRRGCVMSAKTVHMIDETVLKTLREIGPAMTYVVANRMAMSSAKRHDTAIIRRSLIRLEKAGKVKRITDNRNIYKTQLMWEAVSADSLRQGADSG